VDFLESLVATRRGFFVSSSRQLSGLYILSKRNLHAKCTSQDGMGHGGDEMTLKVAGSRKLSKSN